MRKVELRALRETQIMPGSAVAHSWKCGLCSYGIKSVSGARVSAASPWGSTSLTATDSGRAVNSYESMKQLMTTSPMRETGWYPSISEWRRLGSVGPW